MDSDEEFQPRRRQAKPRSRGEPRNMRRKFSAQEDAKLQQLVEEKGARRWDDIAKEMPGRTGRQCRDRFKNYLQPELVNGPWTAADDALLRSKVEDVGLHWSMICMYFPGRSQSNVKNRWYSHLSKIEAKSPPSPSPPEPEEPAAPSSGVVIGEGKCVMMKHGKNRYVCVPYHPEDLEKGIETSAMLSIITWDREATALNLIHDSDRYPLCK